MYGEGANAKAIDIAYLIMDTLSPYNIILRIPPINELRAFISTLNLVLKYLLPGRRVGTVRENQQIAQECYYSSLEI